MKLAHTLLAALAVLGQTAVAGVAGVASADAAGELPKEIITIGFICTWHFQCYKACIAKGFNSAKCAAPAISK
ncbi:hypothetical protein MaudCBS49596_007415 [Microsporum audouinii]